MSGVIFEDIFDVKQMDPDGKKFDRVSRIHGDSESYKMDLILDIATNIYPMKVSDKFRLVLADSLTTDGSSLPNADVCDEWDPRWEMKSNRADDFDYVMYGKCYRIDDDDTGTRISAYVSYGGMLMRLQNRIKIIYEILDNFEKIEPFYTILFYKETPKI